MATLVLLTLDGMCFFARWEGCVWLFRPDAMGHWNDGNDTWHVLDAATGAVLASADLGTVGTGGNQHVHPGGSGVLVDVGEGQDGSFLFRGRLRTTRSRWSGTRWEDRVLVAFAADGRHFMTVHHEQDDVAFHTYPDGELVIRVSVTDLGYDEDAYGAIPASGCAWLTFNDGVFRHHVR